MRITPLLALVLGSPLLVGCSCAPVKLKYVQYDEETRKPREDYSGLTKFTLAKSILLVKHSPTAQAGANAKAADNTALMTSIPAEASGPLTHFGVQQENPRASQRVFQVSKLDNSNLVHRISTEALPSPIAATAHTGMTEVAGSVDLAEGTKAATLPSLPLTIDTGRLLDRAYRGATTLWGVTENSTHKVAFEISFEAIAADAIETRLLDLDKASQLYFYSACRTATITFLTAPLTRQQFTVTVADPHFVQTIALTAQGSITSHSGCGVDVKQQVAEAPDALLELNQAIAQARSLNTAWQTTPGADKASAIAEANASTKAVQKAIKAAATAAAQQKKKRDDALRNAEVQVPRQPPPQQTFAF